MGVNSLKRINIFEIKQNQQGIHYYVLGIRIWTDTKSIKRLIRTDDDILTDNKIKKIVPQPHLEQLSIHLTEHCNLNCQMCDNFSPLAQKEFIDLNKLKNDLKRLAELSATQIDTIELLGGEPLLHPDITASFAIVRSFFPRSSIRLITNGILLPQMKENFWIAAKKYEIVLAITKYPINTDMLEINRLIKKYQLKSYSYNTSLLKTSYRIPFDLSGQGDPRINFINCFHANHCVYLQNGNIYTCSVAACVRHYNLFFKQKLPDDKRNCISIYDAASMDEILSFIAKPIPLCCYCHVLNRSYNHPWKISEKSIKEWTD